MIAVFLGLRGIMVIREFSPSNFERLLSILPERLANSLRWRYFRWFRPAGGQDVKAIGFRWRLHLDDNRTERLMWLFRKHSEEASLDWLLSQVRGNRVLIVDIGANCGAFTIPLITAAGSGSEALAFEPNPKMNERLRVNLYLNSLSDRVTVHSVALGDQSGEATLSFSHNMGEGTLHAVSGFGAHQVKVPVRPLSDYVTDASNFDLFILKIDVEGFEPEILAPFLSASDQRDWPTHILIETEHSDTWTADLTSILAEAGYEKVGDGNGNSFLSRKRI